MRDSVSETSDEVAPRIATGERVRAALNRSLNARIGLEEWQAMRRLDESLGMDSMAVLEFVAGLEHEFGIRFPPEDLVFELFNDKARIVAYLDRSTGGRGRVLP